jgi:hypothetical protein
VYPAVEKSRGLKAPPTQLTAHLTRAREVFPRGGAAAASGAIVRRRSGADLRGERMRGCVAWRIRREGEQARNRVSPSPELGYPGMYRNSFRPTFLLRSSSSCTRADGLCATSRIVDTPPNCFLSRLAYLQDARRLRRLFGLPFILAPTQLRLNARGGRGGGGGGGGGGRLRSNAAFLRIANKRQGGDGHK